MKKVVIFGYNMDMGGAEKALINILDLIKDKCDIDLILLEKKGILMKNIPDCVNVREIKTNIFKYALFRFIPMFRRYIINKMANKQYDLAIAFMEGRACTFVADMKQNCRKIAWIHNDVNVFDIGIVDSEIKKSYSEMDYVVAVSKQSQDSFCNKYGFDKNKVITIYNLIDEEKILSDSNLIKVKKDKFTFINVSRMRKQKRHDRLISCAKKLKDDGLSFELWLIGDGPLYNEVQNQVNDYELQDCVKLLGLLENPFPYVKAADYFVMSSDHEGYPLSLLESLLLKTKVISTDVSGAREILQDKYGYVVDIDEIALYDKMKYVITNHDKKIDNNLKFYHGSNNKIKEELLDLFKL